jgi:dipeptidyl aminopeptidase/acylaminoacyl peptidase
MRLSLRSYFLASALIVSAAFHLSAGAQEHPDAAHPAPDKEKAHGSEEAPRNLNRGHSIRQVTVSPDGKRLAWIEDGEIFAAPLVSLDKKQRVSASGKQLDAGCSEDDLAWSPDSSTLAFFSDCANPGEQTDLYLTRLDGETPRRITNLHGYTNDPAFSPDGKSVAFLYVEGATRPAGALAAMKPFSGVIGEEGIEVQRIAVARVDASGPAEPAIVSPADLHAYEFDWSPDSKSLAYIAADPPGENNWWVARLYTQRLPDAIDATSFSGSLRSSIGLEPKPILAPAEVAGPLHGLQIAVPRWSPDGKAIAFIGGLMSDQGVTGGDVWMVPSAGGQPVDLTPNRPSSPAWIVWDNSKSLYVSELAGGDARLFLLKLHGGEAGSGVSATAGGPVFSFPGTVGDGRAELGLSATMDHSLFVFYASTFDRTEEIYAARAPAAALPAASEPAELSKLTHFNEGIESTWGKSVSISWKSDQFNVQGWLMLPRDYDPGKKYPLLVEVHGGPASAVMARWNGGAGGFEATAFSARDYFVLMPNPRGSYGQGEAFTQANRKDFGYGDLRDILAGVDAAEAKYPIDPNRVGLAGWSYGGFMSMFAVTQTHRFKAAVAGAGIADWLSYYGENSIDQWMIPYFGASVYDDPAVYAKSSAIDFIKQTKTPTLLVVGDRDGECPAPQSFEFWHALRDLNVPTQLVVYPNEGHGFVDAGHRRDVLARAIRWFAQYMPSGS